MKTFIAMTGVLAVVVSACADAPVVKVVGGNSEPMLGYYVEYEVNGTRYRSNEVGSSMNAAAWRLMSNADKHRTAQYYGWMLNKRKTDFGSVADEIAYFESEKQGWTALQAKLKSKWMSVNFPGYQERFDTEQSRREYFARFTPEPDGPRTVEMDVLYDAQKKYFDWACEAYEALKRYNTYQYRFAVQTMSGEIINIITDKLLVPQITPSSAINLAGTMYGVVKASIGAIWDNVNNITGASEALNELVIGKRANWEDSKKELEKVNYMIAQNVEIIKNCMENVKQIRDDIEQLAASTKASQAQLLEQAIALDQQRFAETNRVTITDVPDSGISTTIEAYDKAVEKLSHAYWDLYDEVAKDPTDEMIAELEKAEAAWDKKQEERAKYLRDTRDDVTEDAGQWYSTYQALYDKFFDSRPEARFYDGIDTSKSGYFFGYGADLDVPALINLDGSAFSSILADITKCNAAKRAYPDKLDEWHFSLCSAMNSAKSAFSPIYSRHLAAGDFGLSSELLTNCRGVLLNFENLVLAYTPAQDRLLITQQIAETESRASDIQSRRSTRSSLISKDRNKFLDELKRHDEAVELYRSAFEAMTSLVSSLPGYLSDQTLDPRTGNTSLSIDKNTALGRKFLSSPMTGTAAEAAKIRNETLSLLEKYNRYQDQMDSAMEIIKDARTNIQNLRWAVADTDDDSRYVPCYEESVPGKNQWYTIVSSAYEDFAWIYTTTKLLDGYAALTEMEADFSMAGNRESEYSSARSSINSALSYVGYQRPTTSYQYTSGLKKAAAYSSQYCYAYNIPDYLPWQNDLYQTVIVPVLNRISAARETVVDHFVISYDPGEGTGDTVQQSYFRNRVCALRLCPFEPPEGKIFAGWAGSNDRRYDDGMLVFNLAPYGGLVTLTAIWEPVPEE